MTIVFTLYVTISPNCLLLTERPENIPINVSRRKCTRSHGGIGTGTGAAVAAIDRAAIRQLVPAAVAAARPPVAMGSTRA